MTARDLAPWQLLAYFSLPVERSSIAVAAGTQVAAPNNQRYLLAFSNSGSAPVGVSTVNNIAFLGGIVLSQQSPTVIFTAMEHGILPALAWYSSGGGGNISVMELISQRWPDDTTDHLAAIIHPPSPSPPIVMPVAPGVGGMKGIISYWQSLMSKIKGG